MGRNRQSAVGDKVTRRDARPTGRTARKMTQDNPFGEVVYSYSRKQAIEDGVLVEHYVARNKDASLIGNVYLGRVQNVLPSMEAAMPMVFTAAPSSTLEKHRSFRKGFTIVPAMLSPSL